jgi:hypothetical protein
MKKTNTLALVALATSGMLFANAAHATEKAAEKTSKEKSACSGPNGCDGKDGHKCVGGNACKGHSDCKTAQSACKGHNSCKGQGWVNTKTEEECKAAQKTNAPAAKKG